MIITANDNLTGLTVTNSTIDSSTQFASGGSGPVTLTATNGPLSMTNSIIHTASFLSGNAGAVTATGTTVTLDGTQVLTDATGDDTVGLPMIRSGAVTLTATDAIGGTVTVTNNSSISTQGIVTVLDSSPVTITGRTINILNRSTIDASTHNGGTLNSPANGGTIELRGSIVTVAGGSQLTSFADGNAQSTGTGGNIRFVGTDGIQSANNIQLTAAQLNTSATTLGGAGTIEFVTKRLTLGNTDVGAVTFGPGPGGSISVRGAVNVTLDSGSAMDTSAVNSGPEGPYGPAGTILLETQQLTMQRGSVLRAADLPLSHGDAGSITVQGTIGPGQSILIDGAGTGIFTDAKGTGAGGDITLNANSVTLQNGGTLSAVTSGTASSATGGSIQVDANHVQLNSGATITANSTGAADAGNINLTASNSFTMQNSSITTQANAAGGGTIKITTDPGGTVQLTNSTISASVLDGTGGGGSVNIDPQSVILLNSQILAQAVQGPGGNISITTNLLLPDANSVISASSQFGVNGTVTIQSPNAPTSGQIQPLGKSPLLATSLLNQHCASLAGGAFSSFTVAGRDSLPTEPGGWLSSPLYAAGVWLGIKAEGVKAEGERLEGMSASAGQVASGQWRVGDTPILSLRQIAPPGFLTQAFATDRSAGCQS